MSLIESGKALAQGLMQGAMAKAVALAPDDYDLVYDQAMLAEKPVITLTDSGEPAALVRDGVEGLQTVTGDDGDH